MIFSLFLVQYRCAPVHVLYVHAYAYTLGIYTLLSSGKLPTSPLKLFVTLVRGMYVCMYVCICCDRFELDWIGSQHSDAVVLLALRRAAGHEER